MRTRPLTCLASWLLVMVVALAFCGSAVAAAAADPVAEKLAALKAKIAAPGQETGSRSDAGRTQLAIQTIERSLARGSVSSARTRAASALASVTTDEYRALWKDMLTALEAQEAAAADETGDRMEALLKEATDVVKAAKHEKEFDDLLSKLKEYQNTLTTNGVSRTGGRERINSALRFLETWQTMVQAERLGNLLTALNAVQSTLSNGSASADGVLPRSALLQKQQDLSAAYAAQMVARVDAAAKALAAAITAADVRKVIEELGTVSGGYGGYGESSMALERLRQRTDRLRQTAEFWHRVLSNATTNARRALQELANFEQNSGSMDVEAIPAEQRAKLKAELTRRVLDGKGAEVDPLVQQFDAAVDKAKTAGELLETLHGINALTSIDPGDAVRQDVAGLQNDLRQLGSLQTALENRQYGQFWGQLGQREMSSHRWARKLAVLRTGLIMQAALASAQIHDVKPADGEAPDDVLLRVAGEAVKQAQWYRVQVILEAYRQAFYSYGSPPAWLNAEVTGCRSYIQGQNLEKAGQWDEAVAAYQNVVRQVGERMPAKEATERLNDLRKTHPSSFGETKAPPPVLPPPLGRGTVPLPDNKPVE